MEIIILDTLLKINDVTSYLGVSRPCLRNWIKLGKFPNGISFGRTKRWRAEQVQEFLETKEKEENNYDFK